MNNTIYALDAMVLKLSGNVDHFLQGLSSNTVDAPKNAFLNQYGRIVATFDQQRMNDESFALLISKQAYEPLMQHIEKYFKLNKTSCASLSFHVYCDPYEQLTIRDEDIVFPQQSGRIVASPQQYEASWGEEAFTLWRLENHYPLQYVDYQNQMVLNVGEEFVSFTKGCFLGQEPVSKVYNRSKPTLSLVVRNVNDVKEDEREKMTSRVTDPKTGQEKGFIFVRNRDEQG